jgi:hypothetical protein
MRKVTRGQLRRLRRGWQGERGFLQVRKRVRDIPQEDCCRSRILTAKKLRQQAIRVSKTCILMVQVKILKNFKVEHAGLILLLLAGGLVVLTSQPVTVVVDHTITRTQLNEAITTVSVTTFSRVTVTTTMSTSTYTQPQPGQVAPPVNQQYCGYPFNPWLCNEGAPVTVTGYLTTDSSCTFLYAGTGQNYVVWNLPKNGTWNGRPVQVYGFVYPNWPQGQPFPQNPFQQTVCVGIPMWSIYPFIQSVG